ncbi:hypothetical protein [Halorubellus sp. PRR65]|uniref:DUF7344 domain-containing protein n=1 Tax=Halorubellus sp. PRR65 TaxID=3098148 RepID=UPI002B25782F|nr:hypothetical protein [Halorubellus sp. PRR65]
MNDERESAAGADGGGDVDTFEERGVSPAAIELDEVYRALAHPRRRYLCYTLQENAEWSLDELATKIAAWEHGVAIPDVPENAREQVYVDLYHAHVPKLRELGVVEFDESTETIEAAETATQVLRALEGMGASLDSSQETHAREVGDGV